MCWHKHDSWPPLECARASASIYLHAGGKLSFDAPSDESFDEYVSDPDKPVPYIAEQASGMTREHMTEDQRFASARPDVLVYQSDALDHDVTIAGPLKPSLFVSTSGTDSDFVVKLIDVYPDDYPDNNPNPAGVRMGGYEQLVRGELFRGRFRNSYSNPEGFTPGKMDKDRIRDAGYLSHVPARASDHGSDPEFMVPAGGPESADVRAEYL